MFELMQKQGSDDESTGEVYRAPEQKTEEGSRRKKLTRIRSASKLAAVEQEANPGKKGRQHGGGW